jgi:hypothetical protein
MSYEDLVMRTTRNQSTPRTMDEAFRTPAYAAAIIKPKPSRYRILYSIFNWKLFNERL